MVGKSYVLCTIVLTLDNLATPPLESPVGFHQLQAYPGNAAQSEGGATFPAQIPTPTEFFPLHPGQPNQPFLGAFQGFPNDINSSQLIFSRNSGENSQSTTPTNQPPVLSATPRPTKKGSISTDVPTGRNRGQSSASDASSDAVNGVTNVRDATRRRASLSTSNRRLSRSPNRSHQRRSSAMPNVPTSFTLPITEDAFEDKQSNGRMQIKRSKSANTILVKKEPFVPQEELFVSPPIDGSTIVENESSGDDVTVQQSEELAKTKAARAQSEHRRRVELKDSFDRLRKVMGVPQPRAGKKDIVEQAILQHEYHKQKEMEFIRERAEWMQEKTELLQEIQFLRQQLKQQKYIPRVFL
jgi:hypothetical protein